MEAPEESPETPSRTWGGVSSWAAWPLAAPSATQSPPIVRRLGRAEREALDSDSDSSSSSQMCFSTSFYCHWSHMGERLRNDIFKAGTVASGNTAVLLVRKNEYWINTISF